MDWLANPEAWIGLLTLTVLEIVLGIDNIIFISILVGKLPAAQQAKARTVGLAAAMLMRIGLLFSLSWIMSLERPPVFRRLVRYFGARPDSHRGRIVSDRQKHARDSLAARG